MEYALVALSGPSNIEKKVRELQSTLYRKAGLATARALPAIIPLCFVRPSRIPSKPGALRECLRSAVGREAPYLNSASVVESEGFLFWELAPRQELLRLRRSCEKVFALADTHQVDQPDPGLPDPFPVARGFFLCSLQGRRVDKIPSLKVSEPLRFPAKAAFVLHLQSLSVEPEKGKQDASAKDGRPLWTALYWKKLDEIPLRKTKTAG